MMKKMVSAWGKTVLFIGIAVTLTTITLTSTWAATEPKSATEVTKKANAKVLKELPFANKQDFEDAKRGFIAPLLDGGVIRNQAGQPVWDLKGFSFIKENAPVPDTVNPSLWRQSQAALAWGSVGPGIVVVPEAEQILAGRRLTRDALEAAAVTVRATVAPIDDVRASADYRRMVAGNLLLRLSGRLPATSCQLQ